MKEIKLIIFDLDGTLVDAYQAIIKSFNYTMQRLNYPRQNSLVIRRAVGWGDESLLKPFLKEKDLVAAVSLYRKHHKAILLRNSRLLPKVDKVLKYLKEKSYKLAIASNRPCQSSWIIIRHLGLKKYFDYVLCADRVKHIKPHPEILNRIMQRFYLEPKQAIYIGDMAIDAQAGRRAKVKTMIVTTGSSTREEIKKEKPHRILRNMADLFKILKE